MSFPSLTRHQWGLVCALLAALTYGVAPAFTRAAYAEGVNAAFMILFVTWVRAVTMITPCLIGRVRLFPDAAYTRKSIYGGIWQAVSIFGITTSLVLLPAPLVIVVVFSHTLMLLLFLALRGETKLDATNLLSTVAALFGLSLVLDIWHPQPHDQWIGFGLAFMSAFATANRLYVYGHQTKERNPSAVGAENFIVAGLLIIPIALLMGPQMPHNLSGWLFTVAGSLATAAASFFMFYGISLLGSFQYSLMAKTEPIFSSLFSVMILGEVLKTAQYVGIALVVGSLVAYQVVQKRKAAAS